MAFTREKIWTDDADRDLIQRHGTMTNRQVAKAMGRSLHSIDCRVRILRTLGLMPQPEPKPLWSQTDDRYLVANYARFTAAMLAKDMGRTVEAVNSRLRKLKRQGWRIDAMPRGRGRSKLAEAARAEMKDPTLSLEADRRVLRDEIAKYLAGEVNANRLAAEQVRVLIGKLKQNVLAAEPSKLARYLAMPVAKIVREVA